MKILFLSSWFPLPADNGSKIRIFNLLRGLHAKHEVTLLAFYRQDNEPALLPRLREMCAKVEIVPWHEFNPMSLRSRLGYLSLRPRSLLDTFSSNMDSLISQELSSGHTYQAVILSDMSMLNYLNSIDQTPLLLDDLELAAYRDAYLYSPSLKTRLSFRFTWWKMTGFLLRNISRFRACIVVSEIERDILAEIAPKYHHVSIIPNCVDFEQYIDSDVQPDPLRLIFTGSLAFAFNLDAVNYFLSEIWPLVKEAVPGAQFWITGRNEGFRFLPQAQDPQVHFTGYVDDIRPVVAGSALSVVPLRSGSGTRLKILEALALGTAVVSTSKGAEGLNMRHEEHLLLANTPQKFAAAIIRLLNEEVLRSQLAMQGRELVRKKYNWQVVFPEFLTLVESIGL